MYYTDMYHKQWLLNEQGAQPCPYDYRLQFPNPVEAYHTFQQKQQSKIAALQKIPTMPVHVLSQHAAALQPSAYPSFSQHTAALQPSTCPSFSQHTAALQPSTCPSFSQHTAALQPSTYPYPPTNVHAQAQEHASITTSLSSTSIPDISSLKHEITHLQQTIMPYAELFEPHIRLLSSLYEQEQYTNEDYGTLETIKNDIQAFLQWPQSTKEQLLTIIKHIAHIINALPHIPEMPADTKQDIQDTFNDLKNFLHNKSGQLAQASTDKNTLSTFIAYEKLIIKEYKPFESKKF